MDGGFIVLVPLGLPQRLPVAGVTDCHYQFTDSQVEPAQPSQVNPSGQSTIFPPLTRNSSRLHYCAVVIT